MYTTGGGRFALQFVAAPRIEGQRVQPKCCELCSRMFFREVGSGLRDCQRCMAGARQRALEEMERIAVAGALKMRRYPARVAMVRYPKLPVNRLAVN